MISKVSIVLCILQAVPIAYAATNATNFLSIPVTKKPFLDTDGPESHRSLREDNGIMMNQTNIDDYKYYGEVEIGTPGQKFQLIFDSGSSDMWFPVKKCRRHCNKQERRFDYRNSKSFVKTEKEFAISYGSGHAQGFVGIDSFSFGGHLVKNQAIGVAQWSGNRLGRDVDGIFGLGSPKLLIIEGSKTALQNMVEQGVIPKHQFSFLLRHFEGPSLLSIGGYDESLVNGSVHWAPVNHPSRWAVNVNGVSVGNKIVPSNTSALIDSGTSLLLISNSALDSIANLLKATKVRSGNYQVACEGLPDLEFSINGVNFAIENSEYALQDDDYTVDDGKCSLAIRGVDFEVWVLGDVFMRNKLVIFDADENKIGFATVKK